ncbi:MAG: DUF1552 domain-containing protein [SAR202 cluster bacterium]|nr:DUF1552 domain-containing protein [SAR202 cluster bacterium]
MRGLGTALALPVLEAMEPRAAQAAPAGQAHPKRLAFLFVPNGKNMRHWTPTGEGTQFELPTILEPLADVREYLTVLTGLTHDKARPNGDGPGDHARSVAAFLTGAQPRKTAGADIKAGISVDQYAAQHLGKATRFPSLEIGCERGAQAGNCDSGYSCAYSSNISWASESLPMAKEVDPRLVFERLFAGADRRENEASRARRERYRQSILDMVTEDVNRLKGQLGVRDMRKLDEYFTGIREIEKRLQLAGKTQEVTIPGAQRPEGIPEDFGEHIRLMGDMMVLAFQADLTRIATFMFANDGSNRPYRMIGISDGHHDLSHHGGEEEKLEKIRKINQFHVQQLAYILKKMKAIKEGPGTLLDNTLLVYGCGISDGNRHNHDDLPVLLCGRGGGTIQSGRHLRYEQNTPMNNLFLSVLDRVGVPCHSLGDSTGRLNNLS